MITRQYAFLVGPFRFLSLEAEYKGGAVLKRSHTDQGL